MKTKEKLAKATDLLSALEAELRRLDRWETTPPPAEDLASKLPFCCDTLTFPQWLQFVFLVRMKALIEAGAPLPSKSSIAQMAEEWFATTPDESIRLIRLLREFDALLSEAT